jgi:hypothetical protein
MKRQNTTVTMSRMVRKKSTVEKALSVGTLFFSACFLEFSCPPPPTHTQSCFGVLFSLRVCHSAVELLL